jgi:hypothetical protein
MALLIVESVPLHPKRGKGPLKKIVAQVTEQVDVRLFERCLV